MRQFDEDLIYMQRIADTLQSTNISIALDWYNAVKSRRDRQSVREGQLDWSAIVDDNIKAAKESDALIIEGSRFNYSQAYQTAIALQYNKPVLNLYRKSLPEYTDWPDKFFVSGIDNPLFHNIAYEIEADLPKIIDKFVKDITPKDFEIEAKFTLDDTSLHYIEKIADQTGRSTNSIIRDMVIREASRDNSVAKIMQIL
jgi:hypothetical protein